MSEIVDMQEIRKAAEVLKPVARRTPLIGPVNFVPNSEVYLKPECLQYTGSFKLRGAYYKISQLSDGEKSRGVIACSAGNHAQGVALGATHNGIKSLICLPAGAPISKVEATKGFGAEVCLVPGVYDDAYQRAIELRDQYGYTMVHPFDDPKVIAGQGTIGLEILEDLPDADAIVVPIGGGGLIAGVALAAKSINPNIKVYGVQAAGAPSMAQSMRSGRREHLPSVSTIADGIAVKEPGTNTFELCKRYVDDIVTVTDDETAAAILALIEKQKLVSEGAGAVAVAAVMFGKLPVEGKKVVCMVSGGNVDVTFLNRIITRGLVKGGRSCSITLDLDDKPGQLSSVLGVIAAQGGNVVTVVHDRNNADSQINGCKLHLELETRDQNHITDIKNELIRSGYRLA